MKNKNTIFYSYEKDEGIVLQTIKIIHRNPEPVIIERLEESNWCAKYFIGRKNKSGLRPKGECVSSTYLQGCLRSTRKTKVIFLMNQPKTK